MNSTDPEGATEGGGGLTYSLTGGADQAKFSIGANTGVLTFVAAPDYENPTDANTDNVYEIQVTVTDPGALTDVQNINVTVTNVNEAPTITSNGGGATASVSIPENQTVVTDVQSTDPDGTTEGAGGLTYSLTGGADQAKFSIVANTGVLRFTTAPDYENPTDADTDNVYEVQVKVTDPGGLTDVQNISVTVTNTNEPPEITSNGGGSSASLNFPENSTAAVTDVQSTDPDGTTEGAGGLTYSITGGSDQGKFNIVANTGVLTFKNPPDYENPTDVGGDNIYNVEVTVTDPDSETDEQDIAVTVTNVNEVPTITSNGGGASASINFTENSTAAVTDVQSTDPDGTTEGAGGLTYTLSGGADQSLFSIVANTGVLTFSNPPNFEDKQDANTDNVYEVQVMVTDPGGLTDTQDISVTVTDINEEPTIDVNPTIDGPQDSYSKKIGPDRVFSPDPDNPHKNEIFKVSASDPDETAPNNTLTFSIEDNDLFAINSSSGMITLKKEVKDADETQYVLTVTVKDGGSPQEQDTGTITFDILNISVGVTGDTQATRIASPGPDETEHKITIKFVRIATTQAVLDSTTTTANYEYYWNTQKTKGAHKLESNDFAENPSTTGTVTFLPGEKEKEVVLTAVVRADAKPLEEGGVGVAEGIGYVVAGRDSTKPGGAKKDINDVKEWVKLHVLKEGITLFAQYNSGADDGTKVHVNDVDQGGVADCYFLAAVIQMIRDPAYGPAAVEGLFSAPGGTDTKITTTVTFHTSPTNTVGMPVEFELDAGSHAADLSGDTETATGGKVEVWVQVLEAAYQDFLTAHFSDPNQNPTIDWGRVGDAWLHLTGQETDYTNTNGMSDADIAAIIDAAAGKPVFLSTSGNGDLPGGHVYLVDSKNGNSYTLVNPWHPDITDPSVTVETLPVADLSENVSGVTVGK